MDKTTSSHLRVCLWDKHYVCLSKTCDIFEVGALHGPPHPYSHRAGI